MKIVWSEQARADLRAIHAFIVRDSEFYARQMVARIVARTERAALAPKSGHRVHEYPEKLLREVHEGNYRIVYLPGSRLVEVVTIVHFRQQLSAARVSGK